MSAAPRLEPMPGEIEEAARIPNGWVYRIEGRFTRDDAVPPERIVGAWKVDEHGKIVGDFMPNPRYQPLPDKEGR
jgi:uncharacterized protein YndB with AHSA1/START domain